jgi:organic hydroperoxide reductase OsmC/OhrA
MLSAAGRPNIVVGSPPEFKGEPNIWAPEELLVGSLNTCMMLTFLTLAQAQRLTRSDMKAKLKACLRTSRGTLKSEAELEPAGKTMESVEAHCFIANSINARVTLAPEYVVASPAN